MAVLIPSQMPKLLEQAFAMIVLRFHGSLAPSAAGSRNAVYKRKEKKRKKKEEKKEKKSQKRPLAALP
jgi:hypothetical protein